MSALTAVQTACKRLSLPVPAALFSVTDPQTVQLGALLNEEGIELSTWPDHAWVKMAKETSFTTAAANIQPNAIPADFSSFCDQSMWDRTQDRPVWGPMSPQQWEQELAGPTFTSMYYGFMLRGNDFLMTPTPTAGDSIYYMYKSTSFVYATGDTVPTKSTFTVDTDTSIFPDELLTRGVIWRFLSAKKLSYAQEYQKWIELVQRTVSRDGGMPKLSASRNYPWTRLSPFIPDSGYGQP